MLENADFEIDDYIKIAVLVSGGGTNLQAIIDGIESGNIKYAKIAQVISSNSKAFALERAKKHNIKNIVVGSEEYPNPEECTKRLLEVLQEAKTDLIVLAGYLSILEPALTEEYSGRIINVHPSLIPKYCGKGFYGKRVHEAVLKAGEKESGATVHFVDSGVDTGPVLLQESVPVEAGDTPETLAARVLVAEHKLLQNVIKYSALQFYKTKMAELETGGI